MKFKGTKGPWERGSYRAVGPVSKEEDQSYGMIIPVAFVEYESEQVTEANLNLISAAPELLEALQWIINNSDPFRSAFEMHHNVDGAALFENAQKVIAKALGE